MFDQLKVRGYQIEFHSHAEAILSVDFPMALSELERALENLTIPIEEIVGSGGGESKGTQRLRRSLADLNWLKTEFTLEKTINGIRRESISHEVDHVRKFDTGHMLALEIEWNNKDPFFDRDLENFKRLHAEGAISVGIIVTRGRSLQEDMIGLIERFAREKHLTAIDGLREIGLSPTRRQIANIEGRIRSGNDFPLAWAQSFVADKYGQATTHWRKLEDRVRRGVGNPCPLLLIGLPSSIVTFGEPTEIVDQLLAESENNNG